MDNIPKDQPSPKICFGFRGIAHTCQYPNSPDEKDPCIFPTISNQKYNSHLKEVGKLAGITEDWITEKQSGRTKTREVRPKYELLASHVTRRTFVTMCLRKGMSPEDIRAVTVIPPPT